MVNSIEENAYTVLSKLYTVKPTQLGTVNIDNKGLQELTSLTPAELNDAITILEESGFVRLIKALGTAPFLFHSVTLTPRGKYEIQRLEKEKNQSEDTTKKHKIPPPLSPVGSPYGFTEEDWELVAKRKSESIKIHVAFGLQFESNFYDTEKLKKNIKKMFEDAIELYKKKAGAFEIELVFIPLTAGYGEHLFNKIARDIISSDIVVFDTSDQNPNVMIEMGVALTWGVRVLPIRDKNSSAIPSDISGQTWAQYEENGLKFDNENHLEDISIMIERAISKKINKNRN